MRETSSSTSTSSRMQFGGAGVDARELEQVHHHLIEPANLPDDDVERLLGAFGQVGAAAVEHLDRGRQRGDRRSQLVADVGREASLALEPGLHRIGHLVERLVPIGPGRGRPPEPFGRRSRPRRSHRRLWHTREIGRSRRRLVDHPSAPGEQRRHCGTDAERRADRAQSAVGVPERDGLEVLGLGRRNAEPDRHVRVAVDAESLRCAAATGNEVLEACRVCDEPGNAASDVS